MGTNDADERSGPELTRRKALRATAGIGALAAGIGQGSGATGSGMIASFEDLSVADDNRIVDESGDTVVLRGVSIEDPRRMAVSKHVRGKTATQAVDMLTDTERGWYPRVVRVPARPTDIAKRPRGRSGPTYSEDHPGVQDGDFSAERNKQQPPQPPAFTEDQLRTYLADHYDDVVRRCKERGVYCVVDFHRQWHTQPPGDGQHSPYWENVEGDAAAENHLPYDSEYTNYWARNTYYGDDGRDRPASWGYVDQTFRNEADEPYFEDESDFENRLDETPYDSWVVNQPLVEEAKLFWRVVAQRYADEPHVVFEAFNEPTAPGIYGPVDGGCSWFKPRPLWRTFVDDFATPILETIHDAQPNNLVLMGTPGWSTGCQGLHWQDFPFEDVAVTWHVHPGQVVSEQRAWRNDTDYGSDPCNGWTASEWQGLQDAQSVRPVVVSEFGWQNGEYTYTNREGTVNIRPRYYLSLEGGTTVEYGKPLIEALEDDPRISWVAGAADVGAPRSMFYRDFTPRFFDPSLTNGNWYETDSADLPSPCPEPPCGWSPWDNPNMGQYVKDRLAALRDEQVPFALGQPTRAQQLRAQATDPDDDGEYEDLTGNGEVDNQDVVTYFQNMGTQETPGPLATDGNLAVFDYTGNGAIDYQDLVSLFEEI